MLGMAGGGDLPLTSAQGTKAHVVAGVAVIEGAAGWASCR